MKNILLIWQKEIINTLRDKKTLTMMILVPLLLMPVLMIGLPAVMMVQMEKVEEAEIRLAITGRDEGPALVEFLAEDPRLELVDVADPEASLLAGEIEVMLTLPPGFTAQVEAGQTVTVDIAYEGSRMRSSHGHSQVSALLSMWSQRVVQQRMMDLGVDQQLLQPMGITSRNVAPEERMSGMFLAMIMPMMLVMWAMLGGMYTAIDVAAGEKERLTLEALLISPVSRWQLVLGKYLAVVGTSLGAALITLGSMLISVQVIAPALLTEMDASDLMLSIGGGQIALLLLVSLLTAGWSSAIQVALSVYARSFKEAQSYLSPLAIIAVVPAALTQMVELESATVWYYILPVFNAIFAIKELLMGIINWNNLALVGASSLFYVVLSVALTAYMFGREEVLFRT